MKVASIGFILILLSGCVTPSATLMNDKGQKVTCKAAGIGIISGTMANNRYEQCVSEAQMRGFEIVEEQ
ncbi:MAG: hypothetical protein ACREVE_13755 [Gammaproteobacteria bacterium]